MFVIYLFSCIEQWIFVLSRERGGIKNQPGNRTCLHHYDMFVSSFPIVCMLFLLYLFTYTYLYMKSRV